MHVELLLLLLLFLRADLYQYCPVWPVTSAQQLFLQWQGLELPHSDARKWASAPSPKFRNLPSHTSPQQPRGDSLTDRLALTRGGETPWGKWRREWDLQMLIYSLFTKINASLMTLVCLHLGAPSSPPQWAHQRQEPYYFSLASPPTCRMACRGTEQ